VPTPRRPGKFRARAVSRIAPVRRVSPLLDVVIDGAASSSDRVRCLLPASVDRRPSTGVRRPASVVRRPSSVDRRLWTGVRRPSTDPLNSRHSIFTPGPDPLSLVPSRLGRPPAFTLIPITVSTLPDQVDHEPTSYPNPPIAG